MAVYDNDYLDKAHKYSIFHKTKMLKSEICGCFHCLAVFSPLEIVEWVDEDDPRGETALCPKCGIDAVIGSSSNYPVDKKDFLVHMKQRWFRTV
ncbi:hypothetical protein FFF34_001895 [Inquilinus sp. KBS0705]|nr:hypothetical protein FFF34_001895 [Inquilinus sp. KBS0705]